MLKNKVWTNDSGVFITESFPSIEKDSVPTKQENKVLDTVWIIDQMLLYWKYYIEKR